MFSIKIKKLKKFFKKKKKVTKKYKLTGAILMQSKIKKST